MHPHNRIQEIFNTDSQRVLATLIRYLGDFDLAEDAMAEAFAVAAESWPRDGDPVNPRAWLVSTGRFKAIDAIRRNSKLTGLQADLVRRNDEITSANFARTDEETEDDRLRLIFTCSHPAIDPTIQVAWTLREVGGLTTEQIASAIQVAPATMVQRNVRSKAKIRDAGIPFQVPAREELHERIESVMAVCYLVFNKGFLILLWNLPLEPETEVLEAVAQCTERSDPLYFGGFCVSQHRDNIGTKVLEVVDDNGFFNCFTHDELTTENRLSSMDYLSFLRTLSPYIRTPKAEREKFFHDAMQVMDRFGGELTFSSTCISNVARRRGST
jgi:RNA polymerase sigma factor (sigma-70 family)